MLTLATPAEGAALVAAARCAKTPAETAVREFWVLVSGARRNLRARRLAAAAKEMAALRQRLAHAVARQDRARLRRLSAALADLERLARLALLEDDSA